MKVLVLGANGILGHHLFLLLNDIYNIKLLGICGKSALDRFAWKLFKKRFFLSGPSFDGLFCVFNIFNQLQQ